MTVSGGQQRDSAVHIHVSILPQAPLPSRAMLSGQLIIDPDSFFFNLFFWLHWVILAARRLSLVVPSRGYSLVAVCGVGFSLQWLLLLWSTGSRVQGLP